jgi:AcrR family transcriptional regulator
MKRRSAKARPVPLGRRPGNGNTREGILDAARRLFARDGYSGTTMRAIATGAEVDVSLVSHYFGSKEDLFLEAIHVPVAAYRAVARAVEGGSADLLGERVVRTYLSLWENPETVAPMLAMARSSFSKEGVDELFTKSLQSRLLEEFATMSEENSRATRRRIALAISMLLGLALGRYVFRTAPLVGYDTEELVSTLAPVVEHILVPRPLPAARRGQAARDG